MTMLLRAIHTAATDGTPTLELRTPDGDVVVTSPLKNPLANDGIARNVSDQHGSLVARWSGWLDARADVEQGVFEPSLATWTQPGHEAFVKWLNSELDRRGPERPLLLRPHARHVLGDPQRVLSSFRERESAPVRMLFEPAAFLTADMVDDAQDHLQRSFEALLPQRWTWGTLLTSVTVVETDWGREAAACPITRGRVSAQTLVDLLRAAGEPAKPVALLDEDFDAQREVLEAAGLLEAVNRGS